MPRPPIITIRPAGADFAVYRSDKPGPVASFAYRRAAEDAARALALRTGGTFVEPVTHDPRRPPRGAA